MVVNSDDGFQVSVGPSSNPTQQILAKYDAGRGAADTQFYFLVEKAGVYPFRLLWFEGDGGASVEWFTVNADGSRALVGGTQQGSIPAYRSRATVGVTAVVRQTDGKVAITYSGTLKSSTVVTGPYTAVAGAASPFLVTPAASAKQFYLAE